MVKIKIFIEPDIGMVEGWNHYHIEISNTLYEDRGVYQKQKLLWCKECQCWTTSGSLLMPAMELAEKLKKDMGRVAKEYELELTISEVVR